MTEWKAGDRAMVEVISVHAGSGGRIMFSDKGGPFVMVSSANLQHLPPVKTTAGVDHASGNAYSEFRDARTVE